MTITIKKTVERRRCEIEQMGNGVIQVRCYSDVISLDRPHLDFPIDPPTLDAARNYCESVQLGGVTHWARKGSHWTSDTVYTDSTGNRLTPAELELVRKQLAKKGQSL